MLERTSIFVLDVLPYLIIAICGAAMIPAMLGV